MTKVPHAFAMAVACSLLGGCAAVMGDVRPFTPEDSLTSLPPEPPAPVVQSGGSIFAGNDSLRLFEDNKARHVGDLVTIVLVESTSARTSAATSVNKDSDINMSIPTLAGQGITFNGNPILQAEAQGSRSFDGKGNSAQSNQLSGQITVRVIRELGNGQFLVSGEKRMRLNQGDEMVQIQGIVRAADIGNDNRVRSDRVADARIVYGGRGTLARSNAMGWLGRFFNSAAFPY